MASSTAKSTYLRALGEALPFVLVVGPFGLLFGVLGSEAGLNLAEVLGFSVLVIAGAAQLTALSLLQENAPTLIVIVTALAVNLRMAMYSAALTPHFGTAPFWKRAFAAYFLFDQTYAMAAMEYERRPEASWTDKVAYFFGIATPVTTVWYIATVSGALIGAAIPPEFALDFAVPITFLAVIAPMLKTLAHLAAAAASVVVTLALGFMPYGTGLLVAGLAALVVGAQVEAWMGRRAAR